MSTFRQSKVTTIVPGLTSSCTEGFSRSVFLSPGPHCMFKMFHAPTHLIRLLQNLMFANHFLTLPQSKKSFIYGEWDFKWDEGLSMRVNGVVLKWLWHIILLHKTTVFGCFCLAFWSFCLNNCLFLLLSGALLSSTRCRRILSAHKVVNSQRKAVEGNLNLCPSAWGQLLSYGLLDPSLASVVWGQLVRRQFGCWLIEWKSRSGSRIPSRSCCV